MKKLPAESSHNFLVLIPCKQQVHYAPTDSRTRKIGFSANSFTTVLLVVGGLALAGNITSWQHHYEQVTISQDGIDDASSSQLSRYSLRRQKKITNWIGITVN